MCCYRLPKPQRTQPLASVGLGLLSVHLEANGSFLKFSWKTDKMAWTKTVISNIVSRIFCIKRTGTGTSIRPLKKQHAFTDFVLQNVKSSGKRSLQNRYFQVAPTSIRLPTGNGGTGFFLGAQQTIWIIKVFWRCLVKSYAIKTKKQAYKSQRVNPTKPRRDI